MKLIFDFFASLLGFILLFPIMLVVAIISILYQGSPILFYHERLGKDGRPFTMIKVRDYPNLVRDPKSKAIINMDSAGYNERKQKILVNDKMINMNNEINNLKQSVYEIKDLLYRLVEKK